MTPAIVWQDKRGEGICRALTNQVDKDWLHQTTGLLLDSCFFAPELRIVIDLVNRTPILTSSRIKGIVGRKRAEGVGNIRMDKGQLETVACDTVIFSGDSLPAYEVARADGFTLDDGTRGPQIDAQFRTSKPGMFAAANLLRGVETADVCALEGRQAARHIGNVLQNNRWPAHSIPIEAASPITLVSPNSIAATNPPPPTRHLSFRVKEFCQNRSVQVHQGSKVLHTQTFRRLLPNQSMQIASNWLADLNLNDEPPKIALAS